MKAILLQNYHRAVSAWQPGSIRAPVSDISTLPSVWSVPIPPNVSEASRFVDTLSPEEINKGLRFHQVRHRNRFLLGRVVLRHLLGNALGISPRAVRFHMGQHGKPFVSAASQPLSFSLSYTDGHVIIAIDPRHPIGVDIERVKTDFEFESMMDACFSPREITHIGTDAVRFYTLWTRKEAILKLTGKGIGEHLPSFEVLDGDSEAQRENVGDTDANTLNLHTFDVQPQTVATLCTPRRFEEFEFYRWQQPD